MSFLQSLILGIIQGLTEFLPVSSSAHLVLIPYILEWKIPESQVFPFDVLVQIGTLLAVIVYFRKDLWSIIRGFVEALIKRKPFATADARMGWYLILATIPAGLAGIFLKDRVEAAFNNPRITAIFLFVTAFFLLGSEFLGRQRRKLEDFGWLDALVTGMFQAFSIFPGISRSGSTITGGMLRHFERPAAARFAFLMSIPIMLAAGIFSIPDLLDVPDLGGFLPLLITGFVAAAIVGYLSIHWLLRFLNKKSLIYFAAYCVLLGSLVLILSQVRPNTNATMELSSSAPVVENGAEITQVIRIRHSASTDWLLSAAADCAAGLPGVALLTSAEESTINSLETFDVMLNWGEPESLAGYAAKIDESSLVFIVNPDNPLERLPLARLEEITAGSFKTWRDLRDNCQNCYTGEPSADLLDLPIQLYVYPDSEDVQVFFKSIIPEKSQSSLSSAILVPSTRALNQAILANPAALGYLPAQAADTNVLVVKITRNGKQLDLIQPMLAITDAEPQGDGRRWLACLTREVNP